MSELDGCLFPLGRTGVGVPPSASFVLPAATYQPKGSPCVNC
jgi:hypothetical protein